MSQHSEQTGRDPRPQISVGVDLVAVARVGRVMSRPAASEKLFTPAEIDYCQARRNAAERLAARFAAKEAVFKAFGTGRSGRLQWTDIEVVNGELGRPSIVLHGGAADFAMQRGLVGLDISLSHTGEYALADAVATWSAAITATDPAATPGDEVAASGRMACDQNPADDRNHTSDEHGREPMTNTESTASIVTSEDVPTDTRRGGEIRILLSPRTVGSTSGFMGIGRLRPGEWIAEHYHPYSEEFVFVVAGTLAAELDGEQLLLSPSSALHIPANVRHRLRNAGEDDVQVVFHLGPLAPRPELGHVDTERRETASAPATAGGRR